MEKEMKFCSAMNNSASSFIQRLIIFQKLGLLVQKIKTSWSSNTSRIYHFFLKFCRSVLLDHVYRSVRIFFAL